MKKNLFNKISGFIEKIGKQNFVLIVFILVMLIVTGLYQTFSLYTSSEGISLLDGIKTFKFILNSDNTENSVTIAAGTSKNIAITVSNQDKARLKYAIYYSSNNDLTDVKIGYKKDTEYLPTGLIESNQDYIVTVLINNNSSNNITIIFGILYGFENGGDFILGDNQYFLETEPFPLSEVEVGSYVAYTGTNGCPDGHCDGTNANYVSDTNMGYCSFSSKFSVNGWRVGYIQNDTAYLVSAGAPECMCTSADGTSSNSSCSDYETTDGVPLHLANLDNKALTYCNPTYAYGGTCDSNSAWAMDATDFQAITGSVLSGSSCFHSSEDVACGYGNSLIDNGGYYRYATYPSSYPQLTFVWDPKYFYVGHDNSKGAYGVRPVLRLASGVQVVGGSGTYEDPYRIENPNPERPKLSEVEVGSYVAYTGTNGCPDGHCDGTNANYVSDSNMGYCHYSDYKFSVNGWRVGYIQNDTAYLVSAGAPECMCTNADGTTSNSSCGSSYETTGGVPLHLANLDSKALTYCNSNYAYGGVCNSSSAWAMDASDFQAITGSALSSSSCFARNSDALCGYGNDLIDNGSGYWYATANSSTSANMFSWNPNDRYVVDNVSYVLDGVRPVLRLASSVQVVGGTGTYEDPYQIENPVDTVQYLSDVEPGSYVSYTGTNGCPDGHCDGTNANYVSDSNMGYCYYPDSDYKFSVNGWRVGYIQNDTAYLVSAGAPECMCTSADGTSSNSSCSDYETTAGAPQHLANLDSKALTYCNPNYAYGGVCNSSSAWAIDASDFQVITGSVLSKSSCFDTVDDVACGYGNDLIDNGSSYWYATSATSSSIFAWYPSERNLSYTYSSNVRGVRPVLRLASSVQVVGGSGTYADPYQISNS